MSSVVLTGRGVLCAPDVTSVADLHAAVRDGRSGLQLPMSIADPTVIADPIGEVDDRALTSIERGELRSEKMALHVARQAQCEAGLTGPDYSGLAIVAATTGGPRSPRDWELGGREPRGVDPEGRDPIMRRQRYDRLGQVVAAECPGSEFLGTFNTACSAGATAMAAAWHWLDRGDYDQVLCIGLEEFIAGMHLGFLLIGAVTPGQACDPYGASIGTSLAEGAGAVVFETRAAATARGAEVIGQVERIGMTADGFHVSHPHPEGRFAERAMRDAMRRAGVERHEVALVSGHGTGTAANDAAELLIHDHVFGDLEAPPTLFSSKAVHGHCVAAGAMIELIALTELLRTGDSPAIGSAGRRPIEESRSAPEAGRSVPGHRSVGLSSSFAMGGHNAVVCYSADRVRRAGGAAARHAVAVYPGAVAAHGSTLAAAAWRRAEPWFFDLDAELDPEREVATVVEIDPTKWRRLDAMSRNTAAVVARALRIAGVENDRERVGLCYGTTYGPAMSTVAFSDALRAGRRVNPAQFAALSYSAAASNATELYGMHGHTSVVTDLAGSAAVPLRHAMDVVAAGDASVVIVAAAEEFDGQRSAAAEARAPSLVELREGLGHPLARPSAASLVVARADHPVPNQALGVSEPMARALAESLDDLRSSLEPRLLATWLLAALNRSLWDRAAIGEPSVPVLPESA